MDYQREAELPEPLIYQALEAFMEIYEEMWKYVECDDSKFHFYFISPLFPGFLRQKRPIEYHNEYHGLKTAILHYFQRFSHQIDLFLLLIFSDVNIQIHSNVYV